MTLIEIDTWEEYGEKREQLEMDYLKHINTVTEGDEKYLKICNLMNYYVSLADKVAMITKHNVFFDKLIHVFWEETIENWFECIAFETPLMIHMWDMWISEETLDKYIADKVTPEEAVNRYFNDLDAAQDTITNI